MSQSPEPGPGNQPQRQPGPVQPPSPYLPQPYGPYPYPSQPPYWPQPQQVAPKSVIGAIAISFFLPGAGAMYAGEIGWGIVILVLWIISMPLALVTVGIFTGLACWIAGMVFGATAAQKWNREHGIVS